MFARKVRLIRKDSKIKTRLRRSHLNGCPEILLGPITTTSKVVFSYSSTPTVTGGEAPYSFAITSGSLVGSGLTLNPVTGKIAGITTLTSADYTFTVTCTDSNGCTGSREYTIIINEFFNMLERTVAAGSNLTGGLVAAYMNLFKALNTDRTNIVRLELDAWDDFSGFGVPVIHTLDGVNVIGNNVSVNENFNIGDWSLTGGTQGNGIDQRLLWGINPNSEAVIPMDASGVGIWDKVISDSSVFAGCDIGAYSGISGMFIIPDYLGQFYGSMNDTTVNYAPQTAGFIFFIRPDSTKNQLYKDGVFVNEIIIASTSKPDAEMQRFERGGGTPDWSNATQYGGILVINPSAAMALRLHNAVATFNTAIGRS